MKISVTGVNLMMGTNRFQSLIAGVLVLLVQATEWDHMARNSTYVKLCNCIQKLINHLWKRNAIFSHIMYRRQIMLWIRSSTCLIIENEMNIVLCHHCAHVLGSTEPTIRRDMNNA
jgi:hypothetical protein